jgi:Tfp pilus assembly protein PilX
MKSNNLKIEYLQVKNKQQGAVLFISLMILLVLTLIGVSSLNGSLMEEKMANNAQISTTIFQAAESAIRTTYYSENKNDSTRSAAITRAENNTNIALNTTDDTTRSARLVTPESGGETLCPNSSFGTFAGRAIEIVGNASKNGIQESNAQGYRVCPMRP